VGRLGGGPVGRLGGGPVSRPDGAAVGVPAMPAPVRRPSPKLTVYTGLAATALLAGLALGRPELVVLGAPMALLVIAGLAMARQPRVEVEVEVDRERAVEGDEAVLALTLRSAAPVARLELVPLVPDRLGVPGQPRARSIRLVAGEPERIELRLRCQRWGAYPIGGVHLRAHDPLRLFAWEWLVPGQRRLVVYPEPARLRALVRPFETQVFSGNQVSRQRGDGIEFADVRPFVPGDRARSINWRATARRGVPWVNERHPERNTDVVLFLDSFVDLRSAAADQRASGGFAGAAPPSTLDRAVSAAASLASAYLSRRDRVGLVSFGGVVRWLQPGTGQAMLYRLLDTLMETQIFATVGWRGIRHLPSRTLPPKALMVALTPLLDERGITALFDLLARGYDLAIVDVSPLVGAAPAGGEEPAVRPSWRLAASEESGRWRDAVGIGWWRAQERARRSARETALAERLWALKREALRHRYQELGAAVVEWRSPTELEQVLYEVEACRRRIAPARG
jgi:uncharacterized protein (DUF58 family)